ncbi:MAG: ABC transporter substrate-binding protein, partial [Planctomycetes bacterium]|nr:ABC transporter substrate-binding protein [Planctomycetota bacterium]
PRFAEWRRRGLTVDVFGGDTIDELRDTVRALGRLTGAVDRADTFAHELDQRLARTPVGEPVSCAFVVGHAPLFVAGRASFVQPLLEAAGFRNVFDGDERAWFKIEAEELVQREPVVIVDTTLDAHLVDPTSAAPWAALAPHLEAVRAGRVRPFPPIRPGVDVPVWIDRLCEIRAATRGEATPR